MAFTGPANDQLLIRELYGAYSDATCRADSEAWLSLWMSDGMRRQDGGEVVGHGELREFWTSIFTVVEKMAFFTEIVAIVVAGDAATARCYCHEIVALRNGSTFKVVGIYDDEIARIDGSWRFARRDYEVFMAA